jgi:WD40 repeat protein
MTDSREGHTATSFQDDSANVLIAGGQDASGTVLNTAEVTNTLSSSATSPMNTARVNAATVLLAVPLSSTCPADAVITGGSDGVTPLQTAELFNPFTHTFTLTDDVSLGGSKMNAARAFHTATLLHNSGALKFLVAGGEGVAGVAQASAGIFDVGTKKFKLTTALGGTDMTVARQKHTATAFGETTVLIAGGVDSSSNALATAEVFDLSTNSFTAVGSMHSARFNHAAAILPNGKVLITGGEDGSGNTLNTAEIFDPLTNKFTLTTDASLGGNNMNVARKLHTATAY